MKKLFFVFVMFFITSFVNSQVLNFNFDCYLVVECSNKNLKGYTVSTSEETKVIGIGFGKNKISIDFDKKIVTNEYYVNEDKNGIIEYTNLSNYSKLDGIITFQASRINIETQKPYTEYFVVNENAMSSKENIPYFVSYWFEEGIMFGNVINKNLIY